MGIYLISYGVGGAQALNKLYHSIKARGLEVKNIAITDFAKTKLDEATYHEREEILNILERKKPELVINERSNGLDIQNRITKFCKQNAIKNVTLLDLHSNYENRFTQFPDIIISPSESIKQELIETLNPTCEIRVGGNPAFDRLSEYIYSRHINHKRPNILFVSQPFKELGYSFTQAEILADFYEDIKQLNPNFKIDIKLHPNELMSSWTTDILEDGRLNIFQDTQIKDILQLCLEYDLIIGYNSTVLLQTTMMGIPTLYHEYGFSDKLKDFFNGGRVQNSIYNDFEKNATKKCAEIVQECIKAWSQAQT